MSTLAGQPPLAFVRRPPGHVRCVAAIWMLTIGLTAVGVLLGRLIPALAPGGTPHATLHGTAGEGAGILLHNLRVLAAPVILAGARWAEHRATRLAGDTIVAAIVVCSPITVGAAVGRHGPELVRFLPHVPLEWAALSIAAGVWLTVRRHGRPASLALVAYAIAVLVAAMAAATVETVAVPHAARHAPDQTPERTPDFQSGVRPPQPPEVQAFCRSHGLTTRPPRCCVRVVRPCSGRPWVPGAAAAEQEGHDGGAGIGHGVKQQGSPPCGGVPASPAITLRVDWRSARYAAVRRDARSARDDAQPAGRARS